MQIELFAFRQTPPVEGRKEGVLFMGLYQSPHWLIVELKMSLLPAGAFSFCSETLPDLCML